MTHVMARFGTASRAFSLIELLVVLGILVMLGMIAAPLINESLDSATEARARNDERVQVH